jgi:hypothetical protein
VVALIGSGIPQRGHREPALEPAHARRFGLGFGVRAMRLDLQVSRQRADTEPVDLGARLAPRDRSGRPARRRGPGCHQTSRR